MSYSVAEEAARLSDECLAKARQIADRQIGQPEPPLEDIERAMLDVGIAAGVAGALAAMHERGLLP